METVRNILEGARDLVNYVFHPSSEMTYENVRIIKSDLFTSLGSDGERIFEIDRGSTYYGKGITECPGVGCMVDIDTFHASIFRIDKALEQEGMVRIFDKKDWERNLANRERPPKQLAYTRLKRIHKVG